MPTGSLNISHSVPMIELLREFLAEYGNANPLPDIAGKYQGKNLAVCGDAACVWDDLERLGCRRNHNRGSVYKDGWDFLTINKLVETFPGHIEHAYSNQPALLNKFVAARRNEYRHEFSGPKHTHSMLSGAKWLWPIGGQGTSGLGAVLVGVGLGYDLIVLCGVPLDNGPHNGEPHWRKTAFTNEAADEPVRPSRILTPRTSPPRGSGGGAAPCNKHWRRARHIFGSKIKSMSGRTRDWFGSP